MRGFQSAGRATMGGGGSDILWSDMQLVVLAWLWPDNHYRRSQRRWAATRKGEGDGAGVRPRTDCNILSTSFHLTLCERGMVREREGGGERRLEGEKRGGNGESRFFARDPRAFSRWSVPRGAFSTGSISGISNVFVNANVFFLILLMAALIARDASRNDDCRNRWDSLKLFPISSVYDVDARLKICDCVEHMSRRWVILKANCENVTTPWEIFRLSVWHHFTADVNCTRSFFPRRNAGGEYGRAKVNTDNSWRSMIKARARPRL